MAPRNEKHRYQVKMKYGSDDTKKPIKNLPHRDKVNKVVSTIHLFPLFPTSPIDKYNF